LIAFVASAGALMARASADIIQIPAVSFVVRGTSDAGLAQNGTLTDAEGRYYASVPFTTHGARICRFTLVYRDNDADFQSVAYLYKKRIVVGANPFADPVKIAWVGTGKAAASAGVMKKGQPPIAQPIVDLNNAFYYVEILNQATTLEVLGVQIDVRPSC
jgi:hypothetical protein